MGSPVVRFEIGCKDSKVTTEFYKRVFDWTATEAPTGADIDTGGGDGLNGAITALGHEPHQYVMVYMQVDDVDTAAEDIKANGGDVFIGPIDIPDNKGRFAWFKDPAGNTLGIYQSPHST